MAFFMALSLSFGKHCSVGVSLLPGMNVPLKKIAFYTTLTHGEAEDVLHRDNYILHRVFVRVLLKAQATELSNFLR